MKIYQVIQTKFNQLVQENVRMITNLPTKRISVTSEEQTFLRVINTKNCSSSIVLTATDQKPQKSLKRSYYSASR